ncbi:conserved protein of unknown function [Pararobbsia alpina]|uniref:hypothetical protein n=1 Tax=Pararobbsia alpina TaxID=621374 RepID=UPI0039A6AF90
MTLQSTPPIAIGDVATELGVALPISLGHTWVIALAGKSALPVSLGDLLGKSGHVNQTSFCSAEANGLTISLGLDVLFGGQMNFFNTNHFSGVYSATLQFLTGTGVVQPNWSGNFKITNNTTGVSLVLPPMGGGAWGLSSTSPVAPANLLRSGASDNFTIAPST